MVAFPLDPQLSKMLIFRMLAVLTSQSFYKWYRLSARVSSCSDEIYSCFFALSAGNILPSV